MIVAFDANDLVDVALAVVTPLKVDDDVERFGDVAVDCQVRKLDARLWHAEPGAAFPHKASDATLILEYFGSAAYTAYTSNDN